MQNNKKDDDDDEGDRRFVQEGAIIGGKYLTPTFDFGYEYLSLYFPSFDQKSFIAYYLTVGYYSVPQPCEKLKKLKTHNKTGSSLYKRFMDHCGIRKCYKWFYKTIRRLNFILEEMKKAEAKMDFKRISEIKNGYLDVYGRTEKKLKSKRKPEDPKTIQNSGEVSWSGLD